MCAMTRNEAQPDGAARPVLRSEGLKRYYIQRRASVRRGGLSPGQTNCDGFLLPRPVLLCEG